MGARSEVQVTRHPWPAVFEAFVHALPANGFDLLASDPDSGRLELETRNERITVSTGAIDAITTEWVVDVESKMGIGRTRHEQTVQRIGAALDVHLVTYYGA